MIFKISSVSKTDYRVFVIESHDYTRIISYFSYFDSLKRFFLYVFSLAFEHLRFANNPNCNSYKEEALALHYAEMYSGISADMDFEILHIETNTVNRKILESYYISLIKPHINNEDECISVKQFLIV